MSLFTVVLHLIFIINATNAVRLRKRIPNTKDKIGRIIGGGDAPLSAYPWFVTDADLGCGGSLISSKHVITAAHCAEIFVVGTTIFPGALCLNTLNCGQPREQRIISSWKRHPSYKVDPFTKNPSNDFAIITLNTKSSLVPVAMDLTGKSSIYTREKRLWVAGFGITSEDNSGSQPSHLKHVGVSYVPQRVCKVSYGNIEENVMCAADPGRKSNDPYWEDACQGDSGGPLYDKDNRLLVGIVSYGRGCARVKWPGVYARISDQATWIKESVCQDYTIFEEGRPDFCDTPIIKEPEVEPEPRWCEHELETEVRFELITDSYPEEISVTLKNHYTGETLGELDFDDSADQRLSSFTLRSCLLPSDAGDVCVDLTVRDSYRDGIFLPGGFHMDMDNQEVVWEYSFPEFDSKTFSKLCVQGRTPEPSSIPSISSSPTISSMPSIIPTMSPMPSSSSMPTISLMPTSSAITICHKYAINWASMTMGIVLAIIIL